MGIKKSFILLATIASVAILVLSGFLLSRVTLGFSSTKIQEDKMMMTAETIYIFENGTRVHMGPFEIPCHVEEITERGWVVVPDYPVPSLSLEQSKTFDPQIVGRRTWTGQPPRTWINLQANFGYTFSAIPYVQIGAFYAYSDYGHIEDRDNPQAAIGIYTSYFWYRVQPSDQGYAGVDFIATG